MYRRLLIMATLMQLISGCAAQAMGSIRGGEEGSYMASNLNAAEVEQVDVKVGGRSYFSASSMGPYSTRPLTSKYVPFKSGGAGGGYKYMSDTGHKIPDEVTITWRDLPSAGGQPYTGQLKGPFRVKVREKIPKEVLQAVKRNGVSLEMLFSFADSGVLFDWQLVEFKSVTGSGRGIDVLRKGGDSFQ